MPRVRAGAGLSYGAYLPVPVTPERAGRRGSRGTAVVPRHREWGLAPKRRARLETADTLPPGEPRTGDHRAPGHGVERPCESAP
jgi:hypothetical protein